MDRKRNVCCVLSVRLPACTQLHEWRLMHLRTERRLHQLGGRVSGSISRRALGCRGIGPRRRIVGMQRPPAIQNLSRVTGIRHIALRSPEEPSLHRSVPPGPSERVPRSQSGRPDNVDHESESHQSNNDGRHRAPSHRVDPIIVTPKHSIPSSNSSTPRFRGSSTKPHLC